MPIYKLIKLPDGQIIYGTKGSSNYGGKVIGWKIHNVRGKKKRTYKEALHQLRAIKSSQRRRG